MTRYRSWCVSRSAFCSVAARTVLAAADGCSPVNRCASRAAGGPELPCPPSWRRWRSGLAGGVPATVHCPRRGPAGRCLIASPKPHLPIAAAAMESRWPDQKSATNTLAPATDNHPRQHHSLPLAITPAAANPLVGVAARRSARGTPQRAAGNASDRPRSRACRRRRARRPHHEQHGAHRSDVRHRRRPAVRVMNTRRVDPPEGRSRQCKR
ncbi:MAG: hypothetical protein QOF88_1249 [Mycobacterium sp.]|nr:hypothetical protein [Mycobacterium sp.]